MARFHWGLLLLLVLASWSTPAFGQGQIAGVVKDADTGEVLIGVNLLLVGTSRGAATGLDGSFLIDGINAGSYSVKVSYIGFETKLFTDIRVTDGAVTRLDIDLQEARSFRPMKRSS